MPSLTLHLELHDASLRQRLAQWTSRTQTAPAAAVRESGIALLQNVILANPVDSGRSRSAWVAALEDLGSSPPGHWDGSHPDPAAIAQGFSLGSADLSDHGPQAEVTLTNAVDYIDLLEYGGASRAPRAMVRQNLPAALADLAARLMQGIANSEQPEEEG